MSLQGFQIFWWGTKNGQAGQSQSWRDYSDFYEPLLQERYAGFLAHYSSAPIACKVRRPEEKGKVETAIKYVKNNFLKNFRGSDYDKLVCELKVWNEEICNKRVHGTTRIVPELVFNEREKDALIELPTKRYQIMDISTRKVSRLEHISYRHNYYSVPAKYVGMQVRLESNGTLLKIYFNRSRIALHSISHAMGLYISVEEHKPEYKRFISREEYYQRMDALGPDAARVFLQLEKKVPAYWGATRGLLKLKTSYPEEIINLACKRALRFKALVYQQIKKTCE